MKSFTTQVRSKIRAQLLEQLRPYGMNPDDWTCTVRLDLGHYTCGAVLRNKKTEAEIYAENIWWGDDGEILQQDALILG